MNVNPRAFGPTLVNALRTHCVNGHEFTPENTRLDRKRGTRQCKECARIAGLALYRKRRDERLSQKSSISSTELTKAQALERLGHERLSNYEPVPGPGCWLWSGNWSKSGYGVVPFMRSPVAVHRLFYAFHVGDIPDGLFVCHKCDTPACVNPDHLFLGTHKDNMDDMRRKNRQRYGGHAPRSINDG